MKYLLDTHVLLNWSARSPRLSERHESILAAATSENPLWLATISLWEIATLQSLGRIGIQLPLRDWFEQVTAPPTMQRIGITTAIAAEVAALPDTFHRDPADRLIVATAKVIGATLLTQDRRIIEAGLVTTL